ncbi:hypothetical protein BDZ91DRAFT_790969 [Kalaharituber pfeilii]|nr:hypothetical protein BDZ91DRAFT_790969 [Kalaharituber pfeilii]
MLVLTYLLKVISAFAVVCTAMPNPEPALAQRDAKPDATVPLVKRTEPDWEALMEVSTHYAGFSGQNVAVVTIPANRAICPDELAVLETCVKLLVDECIDERASFEWCFRYKYVPPEPVFPLPLYLTHR